MFCTKCGSENGDNRFCTECGAPLTNPNELETDSAFAPQSPSKTLNVFDQAPGGGNGQNSSANNQNANFGTQNSFIPNQAQGNDNATTVLGDNDEVKLISSNGEEYIVDNLPAVVGKGSAADVIIPGDEAISRRHFCIHSYSGNGYVIEDLGSTNKTYLNGNALEKEELVMLNQGDTIKTGLTTFTVEF